MTLFCGESWLCSAFYVLKGKSVWALVFLLLSMAPHRRVLVCCWFILRKCLLTDILKCNGEQCWWFLSGKSGSRLCNKNFIPTLRCIIFFLHPSVLLCVTSQCSDFGFDSFLLPHDCSMSKKSQLLYRHVRIFPWRVFLFHLLMFLPDYSVSPLNYIFIYLLFCQWPI